MGDANRRAAGICTGSVAKNVPSCKDGRRAVPDLYHTEYSLAIRIGYTGTPILVRDGTRPFLGICTNNDTRIARYTSLSGAHFVYVIMHKTCHENSHKCLSLQHRYRLRGRDIIISTEGGCIARGMTVQSSSYAFFSLALSTILLLLLLSHPPYIRNADETSPAPATPVGSVHPARHASWHKRRPYTIMKTAPPVGGVFCVWRRNSYAGFPQPNPGARGHPARGR
jgi:hypothetical protein